MIRRARRSAALIACAALLLAACKRGGGGGGPTPPAAPTNLAASATSSTSLHLTWSDGATDETGFLLDRGPAATGPWTTVAHPAAGTTSFDDTGLSPATTYWYRLAATSSAGASAYAGPASATTLPIPPTPPQAPTGLAAAATSSTSIHLGWTDNATNETGFKLERAPAATGPWARVASPAADAASYDDTGLSPATTYWYRLAATNAAGDSAYAGPASATTLPTPPAAPSNLAAAASSSTAIHVSWTDNATNETGFKLDRAPTATGPWSQIATPAANATSYDDTGRSSSTTYWYRLRATNAAGDSVFSNLASATTAPSSVWDEMAWDVGRWQ